MASCLKPFLHAFGLGLDASRKQPTSRATAAHPHHRPGRLGAARTQYQDALKKKADVIPTSGALLLLILRGCWGRRVGWCSGGRRQGARDALQGVGAALGGGGQEPEEVDAENGKTEGEEKPKEAEDGEGKSEGSAHRDSPFACRLSPAVRRPARRGFFTYFGRRRRFPVSALKRAFPLVTKGGCEML